MYQNAGYNQGYASSPHQQYGGGGYYGNNDNLPAYGNPGQQYGAPSPVNAAYQRANAAMAGMPGQQRGASPGPQGSGGGAGGGGGASGLIRLNLRKPMGIVFEPMTDPHNPSQQRGVRICDLPRTGAAAMSQKLEVGDELLSINDKTMSRLTFDEIMDFIIEADKERVDLLFRRPGKDKLKGGGAGGGGNVTPGATSPGGGAPISPMGLGGVGSNSNSVKWIDEKSDAGGGAAEVAPEPDPRDDRRGRGREGGRGGSIPQQDDPSVDDTYGEYTVESQSQYTMETYEEDRRRRHGGGRGADSRYSEDESKGHRRRDPRHGGGGKFGRQGSGRNKSDDPVESTGFLDLLIDTLCTSVMGRDARDMCGDRSDRVDGREDDEYTVDDGTITTNEDRAGRNRRGGRSDDRRNADRHHRSHRKDEEESLVTEDDGTLTMGDDRTLEDDGTLTQGGDDDGTQTLESKEVVDNNAKKHKQLPPPKHPIQDQLNSMSSSGDRKGKSKDQLHKSSSKQSNKSKDMADPLMNLTPHTPHQDNNVMSAEDDRHNRGDPRHDHQNHHNHHDPHHDQMNQFHNPHNPHHDMDPGHGHQFHDNRAQDPPPQYHPPSVETAPDPPTKAPSNIMSIQQQFEQQHHLEQQQHHLHQQQQQQYHHQHNIIDHQMGEQESAMASGIALPVKELEYDDRVDYAADVSVMESLGGPSLLVERARHENAVGAGHDRASFYNLDRQDPELAELVAAHGLEFAPDPGMTKEETAFRDPYKFYEHAVCQLLRENEPEKVRLLSKLMAKYRGRERHLINKLSARYNKDKGHHHHLDDVGGGGNEHVALAASGSGAGDSRSNSNGGDNANGSSNNPANKPSLAGMEKIHEGGEDEEAGSSVLNDPSRANIAAIETAKKKQLENNGGNNKVSNAKSSSPTAAKAAAMQQNNPAGDVPKVKSSHDDGWPPAMSDPWGTGEAGGGGGGGGSGPAPDDDRRDADQPPSHIKEDESDEGSYSDGSSYSESEGVDGTSPAIIAQVSELLNYVYGKTSVAGQIDRVSTIMRAYEGREAVLLELLETKALIKANADSNRDAGDLPVSLRNSPGLANKPSSVEEGGGGENAAAGNDGSSAGDSKKLTPQTPVSVLTAPTMEYPMNQISPASMISPKDAVVSPSAMTSSSNTVGTTASSSKKKKKGIFGGFFGGKKKDRKGGGNGNFPSSGEAIKTNSSPSKNRSRKMSKKGQPLNESDGSI